MKFSFLAFSLMLNVIFCASDCLGQAQNAQPDSLGQPTPAAINSYNTAVNLIDAHKEDQAIQKLREAIAEFPNFVAAHYGLGTLLAQKGDKAGSLKEYEKAAELNPNNSDTWTGIANCALDLGKTKEALAAYKKIMALEPNGKDAAAIQANIQVLEAQIKREPQAGEGQASRYGSDNYFAQAAYGGLDRWKSMPIRVYIRPAQGVPGYRQEYRDIFEQATADWEKATSGKVSFVYVDDPSAAQLTVSYTNSTAAIGTANDSGYTRNIPDPASKGAILRSDMKLRTVNPAGGILNRQQALRQALHELGHALGVRQHSTEPNDVMGAFLREDVSDVKLSPRDQKTMLMIYGPEGTSLASEPTDYRKLSDTYSDSPADRCIKLSNQAGGLVKAHDYAGATKLLEEAIALQPDDPVINGNLGLIGLKTGNECANAGQYAQAEAAYRRAIPFLEKGPVPRNLFLCLKNYSYVLHQENRQSEAAAIDARVAQLSSTLGH